jgi:hypothetical protein
LSGASQTIISEPDQNKPPAHGLIELFQSGWLSAARNTDGKMKFSYLIAIPIGESRLRVGQRCEGIYKAARARCCTASFAVGAKKIAS